MNPYRTAPASLRGPFQGLRARAQTWGWMVCALLTVNLLACGAIILIPDKPEWDCAIVCQFADGDVPAYQLDARTCRCGIDGAIPFAGGSVRLDEYGIATCDPDVHTVSERLRSAKSYRTKHRLPHR